MGYRKPLISFKDTHQGRTVTVSVLGEGKLLATTILSLSFEDAGIADETKADEHARVLAKAKNLLSEIASSL